LANWPSAAPPGWCEHFGNSYGAWLHAVSWGRDERPVVTESEPVSMSRETTFERDLHAVRDRAELGAVFTRLCEQVAADLQRKGYAGKTIGIKLRYDNFQSVTRDTTIDSFTADAATIRRHAGPVPQARGPEPPHPPAGRAGGQTRQARDRRRPARPLQ
jgi:DNA polymerase IV